jgi:hypothetical protein
MNGEWVTALYAFLGGAVAKWLARGFEDNVKRIRYEQALIERGMTPEEAGQQWLKEYTR